MRRNVNIFNIRTKKKNRVYINKDRSCEINNIKGNKVYLGDETFTQSLLKYIGQTITIYITGGGDSGSGFTGVLLDVKKDYIKILSKAMSPPAISLGSLCEAETIKENCEDPLGIVTNIPIDKIAAFVHNVI